MAVVFGLKPQPQLTIVKVITVDVADNRKTFRCRLPRHVEVLYGLSRQVFATDEFRRSVRNREA